MLEGDCLKVMGAMPAESFDVVVTSPPYNLGIRYAGYSDDLPRESYLEWIGQVGLQVERLLRHDGSLFLNVGSSSRDPWIAMDVAQTLRRHLVLQNHITWVKSISVGDDTVGHFKPINSGRYLNNNFESIFHFTKRGDAPLDRLAIGVPFKDKSNIGRWGHAKDKRCRGNAWFIPYKTVRSRSQKFHHPCTFPVELAEQCISLHPRPNPVVLDPFLGTGTTLVAAKRLGVEAVGIELDGGYAETARARIDGCEI